MSRKLERMTTAELVERFAEIGIAQNQALLGLEIAKFNRLFDRMTAVRDELRRRPGDQRSALLILYDHPNAQVRLQAAKVTLAIAPDAGRTLLENLAGSRDYPQSADAGMALRALDQGIFKPT